MYFQKNHTKELKWSSVTYLFLKLLVILSNLSCSTAVHSSAVSENDNVFQSCTGSIQEEAHANLEKWGCKPIYQIVTLEIPNATYARMLPNQVRMKKCGGTCSSSL